MYGATEATARMAYLPPELAISRPTSIGGAIPGGSLTIEPLDGWTDDTGELVYRGPNVMMGYDTTLPISRSARPWTHCTPAISRDGARTGCTR